MRSQTFASLLCAAAVGRVAAQETGLLGDADVVTGNPVGAVYRATLPEEPWFKAGSLDGNVKGYITATAPLDGVGVEFTVHFENLPSEGGPFMYHLHVDPVPANGNCTRTLAHLDPFIRGENTTCDASRPESCQTGDTSGKFGAVGYTDVFHQTFVDPYSATRPGLGSFFGNRSFVFHFANKTRISCANFELVSGTPPPSHNCTTTGGSHPTGAYPSPTSTYVPAGASSSTVSLTLLMVAFAGAMFAF